MREAAKHVLLLAASLGLLTLAILSPSKLVPALLASLIALAMSPPNFSYPYPQSYAKYDYVYRRYVVRVLAVAYVLLALAAYPSFATECIAFFVSTYSILSFYVGEHAFVTAFLLLIAAIASPVLLAPPPPTASPELSAVFKAFIALSMVAAPGFLGIYYAISKYYSKLYEHGKIDEVKFPLRLGVRVALSLLLTGFSIVGVAATIYLTPLLAIPTFAVLVGAVGAIMSAVEELTGRLWSYLNYSEDFVNEAAEVLLDNLAKTGWEYEVKRVFLRRGVKVIIKKPFKAKIVVREWVHRAYLTFGELRTSVRVGTGTIITVSPGPERAPRELRELMVKVLEQLRLENEAAQWAA